LTIFMTSCHRPNTLCKPNTLRKPVRVVDAP
jgi:hypothetical protein